MPGVRRSIARRTYNSELPIMNRGERQYCPICRVKVAQSPRYPRYLCNNCAAKAADENGRRLKFYNESFSGGFIAEYADSGEARDSHICFIDGVKCWADEAHMGGIVIQPVGDSVAGRA